MKTSKTLQQIANSIARAKGYWRADCISLVQSEEPKLLNRTENGYRKISDGQYVPKAYVRKAWSRVYYQNAHTEIGVPISMARTASDWSEVAMSLGSGS